METNLRRFRFLKAALLATTIIATPGLAHADPVTLTALAATAAGAAISSTTIAGSAILASIIGALVAASINFAGQLLFGRNLDSGGQSRSRTREFDPHPPFRFAFGEFPQEGAVVFHHSQDKQYYMAILLNSVPSDDACITKIEINDGIELTIAGLNGDETAFGVTNNIYDMTKGARVTGSSATPSPFGVNSTPELIFWVQRGEETSPPSQLLTEIGDVIKSTDTYLGNTVCWVRVSYGNDKQAARRWTHGKPPPLKFFGKWAKLYDPRKDATSGVTQFGSTSPTPSPLHDFNDRTTWEWSSNPALAALMLVTHTKALGMDTEIVPIQQYADAADDCEVEDGGVSEQQLYGEDWTGSAPAAQALDQDPGSGVVTFNRGSVELRTGTDSDLNGVPVCSLYSTDTDGTLIASEYGRMGFYVDMQEEGRRADIEYLLEQDFLFAGEIGQARFRYRIYQADGGGKAQDLFGGGRTGATLAEQADTFMPPTALSSSITLVYDRGDVAIDDELDADTEHQFEGRYVSVVIEGGEPNESDIEVGPLTLNTTSQSGKTRFRCDGLVVIEERELEMLEPVLACMAGHLDTTDGLIGVRAGVWVAPTETLSEPVGDEIEVNGARDGGFDTVRAKFIGRHRDWQETDGPGYALRAGSRVHPLHLGLVREPEQAARLEKIFALRAEPNRIVTGLWDGREANRRIGERVNFGLSGFARAQSSYVITSKALHTREVDDGFEVSVAMTLVEDVAATYDWTAADYEEAEASTAPPQEGGFLDEPASVVAEQSNYNGPSGATARLKITVTISADLADLADHLRVETTDGSGFTLLTEIEVDALTTSYIVYLYDVVVGLTYTARSRAESDTLGASIWVASNSVTITAATLDYDDTDYSAEYA